MTFDEFKQMALISIEEICLEIFRENPSSIKIKKQAVAVKNLAKIFDTALALSNEKGFQSGRSLFPGEDQQYRKEAFPRWGKKEQADIELHLYLNKTAVRGMFLLPDRCQG